MGKKHEAVELTASGERPRGLRVRYGGKTYRLPLASQLSTGEAMALQAALHDGDGGTELALRFYEMVCRHVPKEAVDALSQEDFAALIDKWANFGGDAGKP